MLIRINGGIQPKKMTDILFYKEETKPTKQKRTILFRYYQVLRSSKDVSVFLLAAHILTKCFLNSDPKSRLLSLTKFLALRFP